MKYFVTSAALGATKIVTEELKKYLQIIPGSHSVILFAKKNSYIKHIINCYNLTLEA
jgi:hypothetical protein